MRFMTKKIGLKEIQKMIVKYYFANNKIAIIKKLLIIKH